MPIGDFIAQKYLGVSPKAQALTPEQQAAANADYQTKSGLRETQKKAAAKSLFASQQDVGNLKAMYDKQAKDMAAATAQGQQSIHQQQAQALSGALSAGGRNLAGGGGQYGLAQSAARNAGLTEAGFMADQAKAQMAFEQQRQSDISNATKAAAQAESDYAKTMQDVGTEQDAANENIAEIQKGLAQAKSDYSHWNGNDYNSMVSYLMSQKQLYGGNPKVSAWIDRQINQVNVAKANVNPFGNDAWDAIGNV